MAAPPPFPDEPRRLAALRSSGALETGADPRLDTIVERVAAMFKVPIAAVTLLDETHQWFKASVGLGVPHTPVEVAFCGHTILRNEPLIVLDAETDARFCDNPLVLGPPGIRFYAGTPVFDPTGLPLGALCAIDTKSRPPIAPELLEEFRALAAEASAIIGSNPPG